MSFKRKNMAWYEAAILIVIAIGEGYFVYAKEFKQKDCGCGSGKNCHSGGKKYK